MSCRVYNLTGTESDYQTVLAGETLYGSPQDIYRIAAGVIPGFIQSLGTRTGACNVAVSYEVSNSVDPLNGVWVEWISATTLSAEGVTLKAATTQIPGRWLRVKMAATGGTSVTLWISTCLPETNIP